MLQTDLRFTKSVPANRHVAISSGERVYLSCKNQGELVIEGQDADAQLTITWHDGKPQVTLARANLLIEQADDIALRCRSFRVDADRDIRMHAAHELELQSTRMMRLRSEAIEAVATLGDIFLRANDYVRALGEKILLNTDKDPQETEQRARDFLKRVLGYELKTPKE